MVRWLIVLILSYLLIPPVLPVEIEAEQDVPFESVFREYFSLTKPAAEAKDPDKLLTLTNSFERQKRGLRLAQVFIWNKEWPGEKNLLFSKSYRDTSILAIPKIHYADESKVNIHAEADFVLVDYHPPDSKLNYRIVFLR